MRNVRRACAILFLVYIVAVMILLAFAVPGIQAILGARGEAEEAIHDPHTWSGWVESTETSSLMPVPRLPASPSSKLGIQQKIRIAAAKHGVNERTALRIANCESGFKWDAASKTSSALGVYQWTSGTWAEIGAPGDRLDEDDNITAFMVWYPRHSGWWECT